MRDLILDEMNELNADGVEFIPIVTDITRLYQVYADMSKEEYMNTNSYPKSGRRYYKLENGNKIYLDEKLHTKKLEKMFRFITTD